MWHFESPRQAAACADVHTHIYTYVEEKQWSCTVRDIPVIWDFENMLSMAALVDSPVEAGLELEEIII